VWRPGIDPLGEDEELDYDPTAYDCLHKFALEWPCLSFDIVRDDLGGPRSTFPHTVFMLAGTQVTTHSSSSSSSSVDGTAAAAEAWWSVDCNCARVQFEAGWLHAAGQPHACCWCWCSWQVAAAEAWA
jgi:hypothetical protein